MEIRLYFQMLKRGWWLIVSAALAAICISLALSYATTPQFRSAARLIISPNSSLGGSTDIVRSLDTLDRISTVSTYAEVLGSNRMYEETLAALQLNPVDLKDYSRSAVVLPDSSVLELSVSGPNPTVAAQLANAISRQTIAYTRDLNQIYKVDFLDTAIPAVEPFSPLPLRDASLALVLGIAVGAVLAILREQIRVPLDTLLKRNQFDATSSAYNRRYFRRNLEEIQASSQGNVGLGLIYLDGLSGLIETLPPSVTQRLHQLITSRLRRELRGNDLIGRWGDLQYAVILPATPTPAAERTLERIRQALLNAVQLEQINTPIMLKPFVGGVVSTNQEPTQALIERAEKALELARQNHFAGSENLHNPPVSA